MRSGCIARRGAAVATACTGNSGVYFCVPRYCTRLFGTTVRNEPLPGACRGSVDPHGHLTPSRELRGQTGDDVQYRDAMSTHNGEEHGRAKTAVPCTVHTTNAVCRKVNAGAAVEAVAALVVVSMLRVCHVVNVVSHFKINVINMFK